MKEEWRANEWEAKNEKNVARVEMDKDRFDVLVSSAKESVAQRTKK